nr:hypothetical protein [Pseudanabaena sp. BC1403]
MRDAIARRANSSGLVLVLTSFSVQPRSYERLRKYTDVRTLSRGLCMTVHDFVAAWDKVMNLDRFDLK